MEKHEWLWKRKFSETNYGETESSSSIEDATDNVKSLTEKLSTALVSVSAKEDMVKQHSKIAEEAITGWEKTENEVEALKKKLDVYTKKNSSLEDQVSHINGALKECVRQLEMERLMDDFLEMERLAALPNTKSEDRCVESKTALKLCNDDAKKVELKLEELQKELDYANESKQFLESQVVNMETEIQIMSSKIKLLEAELDRERNSTKQITVKYQEREEELQQTANSSVETKVKQKDLAVAAGKLAECQETIASLGKQLESFSTFEDFLIDNASIPAFSAAGIRTGGGSWKLHSNETFLPAATTVNDESALPQSYSSSSTLSLTHAGSDKYRNGFVTLFTRSKGGVHLEI